LRKDSSWRISSIPRFHSKRSSSDR
jgi:hypothetical protein